MHFRHISNAEPNEKTTKEKNALKKSIIHFNIGVSKALNLSFSPDISPVPSRLESQLYKRRALDGQKKFLRIIARLDRLTPVVFEYRHYWALRKSRLVWH